MIRERPRVRDHVLLVALHCSGQLEAHRLGLYDRTTFYSLPRWARGLQLLDHSTPWSAPLSDLSRQYTRDLA